jgi:hypothetical protein
MNGIKSLKNVLPKAFIQPCKPINLLASVILALRVLVLGIPGG